MKTCKKTVIPPGWWSAKKCSRNEWKDGYCKQHHPDTVAERRKKEEAAYDAKRAHDPVIRLMKCRETLHEVIALTKEIDRFACGGHWGGCTCDHGCDGRMPRQSPKCPRCVARDRFYEIAKEVDHV